LRRRLTKALACRYLGYKIGETTVKNILLENGYDTEPNLTRKTTWKEFIKSHGGVLSACDFFSIELFVKNRLIRCRVLFAIDMATRKVEIRSTPVRRMDGPKVG
jgi:putative transposase